MEKFNNHYIFQSVIPQTTLNREMGLFSSLWTGVEDPLLLQAHKMFSDVMKVLFVVHLKVEKSHSFFWTLHIWISDFFSTRRLLNWKRTSELHNKWDKENNWNWSIKSWCSSIFQFYCPIEWDSSMFTRTNLNDKLRWNTSKIVKG